MTRTHFIGLLLGTEDDWPTAFEQYLARLAPRIDYGGDTHEVATERVTIEPFDLRQPASTPSPAPNPNRPTDPRNTH